MARSLTTAVKNELATNQLNPVNLIYLNGEAIFQYIGYLIYAC